MAGPLDQHISEVRASSGAAAAASGAVSDLADPLPLELAILLHGVTQRFDRFDRLTLGEHGVDAAEYLVLSLLTTGDAVGRTPREMQDALQQTSGGMTRCLDRLERKGLVTRRVNAHDRRSVRVVLTPEGAARARDLMAARVRSLEHLFEPLGPTRPVRLREQLHAVIAALDLALERRQAEPR